MIDPAHTTVIVNPAAAGGRVGRDWAAIEEMLRRHIGPCRFVQTGAIGDATTLAAEAVHADAKAVLSLGGDGTHSEVLNGILAAAPPPAPIELGILPAGTGGDFRRLLLAARDLEHAAVTLPDTDSVPIDVGSIEFQSDAGHTTRRWFLNIASAGMSGLVCRKVNESRKLLGGRATFYLATFQAFRTYQPAHVRIVVDDQPVGEFVVSTVAVCNGRYAGGGMMFSPTARLADGILDVTVIRHSSMLTALLKSGDLYKGTHVQDRELVSTFRGRVIRVETIGIYPAWVDVDGEAPGIAPAVFRVHPKAIRLLGPRPDVV